MRGSFARYRQEASRISRLRYGLVLEEVTTEAELVASFNGGEEVPREFVDRVAASKKLRPIVSEGDQ